jgi:uncharacterized membrane protein
MSIFRHLQSSALFKPVMLLLGFTFFCLAMLLARIVSTDTMRYTFLVWNLFLAWIPLAIAVYMQLYFQKKPINWVYFIVGGLMWLLFLPNAPYIITDLLHLRGNTTVPVWFDSLLVFSYAMAGLQAGLFSLYIMQQLMEKFFSRNISYTITALCVWLASYGVYLGRFQRWNSWDLFTNPTWLLMDSLRQLTNPTAIKMTVAFACILTFFYLLFLSLIHWKTYESTHQHPE